MFTTAFATAWARRTMALGVLLAITLGTALAGSTGLLLTVPALTDYIPMFATGSSIALFISVFVVAGAITFSVDQRGRELALFRAVGASRRQVKGLVMGETALVACVGVAIGVPLSYAIVDATVAYMRHVEWLPPGSAEPNSHVAWIALVSAAVIGVLVALVAALPAAGRASRARPIDALRNAAIPVRVMTASRTVIGVMALGGGVVLLFVVSGAAPSVAIAISILTPQVLTIALVALGPVFIGPLIRLVGMPLRAATRSSGTVAMAQLRTGVRRSTSTAGTAITLVGVFGALIAVPQTLLASESASNSEQVTAELLVSDIPADASPGSVGLSHLVMLPHTEAVVPETDPEIEEEDRAEAINEHVTILRADVGELGRVVSLSARSGSLEGLSGERAVVSSELTLELEAHVGDSIPLRLPDGTETAVTVAGIADLPSILGAQVIVDDAVTGVLAEQPWVADAGLASVRQGAAVAAASAEIERALPGATVATTDDVIARRTDQAERYTWISMALIAGVATLFSVISIANTQAMGGRERRADVTLLRRTGATPGQVVRVVVWEVALTTTVGVAMGAALALFAAASAYALAGNYMVAPRLAVPWEFFAALSTVALVVAVVSAVLPLSRSFWRAR